MTLLAQLLFQPAKSAVLVLESKRRENAHGYDVIASTCQYESTGQYEGTANRQRAKHTPQPFYGPFFRDQLSEPVPEENFWTLWCQGRLTEADTDRLAGRNSIQTNQCQPPPSPIFLQDKCPSCRPTNSVKALKATSTFGLGRRR